MINQNSQFFAILTNVGVAKQANADALGVAWKITQMAVGDANDADPVPNATQTKLVNERRRAPLNQLKVDPTNAAIIIAEQVIPAEVGGWWIREIGLYDVDGDLVAIANCAPSFKPLLTQGSGRTQVVRVNLLVSNSSSVELKIDPSVVLATREYVDVKILEELYKLDNKQSVRVATTANIALTGLQSIDGVTLAVGDRVLVKNQNAAKDNGIWVAAAAGWSRAGDADSNAEVTSALLVSVEQGTTLADTRWQLITDGAIVPGATALTFQNVTQGFAPINSPALINPTANTPAQFDSSLKIATTEFVRRASGSLAGYVVYTANTVLTAADAGKYIYANAVAITLTLPDLTRMPAGTKFYIQASASTKVTVASVNGNFTGPNGAPTGSPNLILGEGVASEFVSSGTGWIAVGGTGLSVLAANGYQKLSGGLIIQWGSAMATAPDYLITFGIAFPVGPMSLVFGQNEGSVSFHSNSLTATGFKYRNAAATYPDQFTWLCIGY